MIANDVRVAFLWRYQVPAILVRYPRFGRAVQQVASLNRVEVAACIRHLQAGHRLGDDPVDHYGGTRKVVADAWGYRKGARMHNGFSPRQSASDALMLECDFMRFEEDSRVEDHH